MGHKSKFKQIHYLRDASPTTRLGSQKDRGPMEPRSPNHGERPGLLGGFGGRLFEAGGFGRGAHRGRRSGAARDPDGHRVEIAGADLALMPCRGIAMRFRREFLLLQLGIGGHAGIAAGARLVFLPPYSQDLNPIEKVFAKPKHLLRKAAERTFETTWRRIGRMPSLPRQRRIWFYLNSSR
jgi:hypothetical protein